MKQRQDGVVGFGPPGDSYPHVLVIESQQPGPDSIEIQLILDDRKMTDHVRYTGSDQRRRMVATKVFDDHRRLQYAELSLPPGTKEVVLEPFGEGGKRIKDLCCRYDLYSCRFSAVTIEEDQTFREGVQEYGGARIKYSKNAKEDYGKRTKSARKIEEGSFFANTCSLVLDLFLLLIRVYVGALFTQELGWRKPEHCLVGAMILGLLSTRTLGSTLKTCLGSALLKVSILFIPVVGVAAIAVSPGLQRRIFHGSGIMYELNFWLSRIRYDSDAIIYAVQWSLVTLVTLWFFAWIFSPDREDDESS